MSILIACSAWRSLISFGDNGSLNSTSTKSEIVQGKRNGRYHAKHVKAEWCYMTRIVQKEKNEQTMDDKIRKPSHLSTDYTKG